MGGPWVWTVAFKRTHTHLSAVVVSEFQNSAALQQPCHTGAEKSGGRCLYLGKRCAGWGRPGDSVVSVVALSESPDSLGVWLL